MDDFGGKLRQARERRGISLRQIAASTKISAAALDALERNDISKLPGGIFSRAFVRSYAVEVGLDPDVTVREFLDRFNQEAPPTAESVTTHIPEAEIEFENKQRTAALVLKIAMVAIPVLLALGYFALRARYSARGQSPAAGAPSLVAPDPSASPDGPPPAAPAPTTVAAAGGPGVPAPGQITLDLHPRSDCWVSLTIDGRTLFSRIMLAGETESHAVAREAVIEVRDAGAFAFAVNGREGKPIGDKGQVKTLKLTPATATQYLR